MGHDHHFLSRLDRVNAHHVELALSLYRDDELIRSILQMAEVPELVERVAIALSDGNRGPYLIVARDGHFVTCLGEGMSVGDTYVISRARLDSVARYLTDLHTRIEAAGKYLGKGELLFDRLYHACDAMSRDEIQGMLAMSDIIRADLISIFRKELSAAVLYAAQFKKRPGTENHLRASWERAWALAHLAVLIGVSVQPGNDDELGQGPGGNRRLGLAASSMALAWSPLAVRGVRSGSLAPELVMSELESDWVSDDGAMSLHALFSMMAMAARHPALQQDVIGIVSRPPGCEPRLRQTWHEWHHNFMPGIIKMIEEPDEAIECLVTIGQGHAVLRGKHLPITSPGSFSSDLDVPRDLALAIVSHVGFPIADLKQGTFITAMMSVWAGRAEEADFYPPLEYAAAVAKKSDPARARKLALLTANQLGREEQPKAASRQRPNDPCSCGSGKKYKRCCGSVVVS